MRDIYTYQIDVTNRCSLNCKHCYALKHFKDMPKFILDKCVDYIIKSIDNCECIDPIVNFSGGEVGLYNEEWLLESIKKIKTLTNKTPKICYQTSLVYDLTDKHKDIIQNVDLVGTSFDYKIRFTSINQEIKFFNNLNIVKSLNDNIEMIITLNKDMIKDVSPKMLFSFMISTGLHKFELERLCKPMIDNQTYDTIRYKNKDVRNYLYDCFKLYIEYKKYYDITIGTFDCLVDSFNGNYYYEHGRDCCKHSITFSPNGNISTCFMEQNLPYGNIINDKIDEMLYNNVIKIEETLDDECLNCKYLQWCKGDCHRFEKDDSGCSTPYIIYEHLKGLNNA